MLTRQRAILILVSIVFVALAVRQSLFVDRYAVDVLYWDAWDLYRPLFAGSRWWGCFDYQWGPHRQGLGGLLIRLLAPHTRWDCRWDAFSVSFALVAAAALGVWLAWCCGVRGWALLLVPPIYLNVHQCQMFIANANPSHGALPVLMFTAFCVAGSIRRPWPRRVLQCALTFLLIFTGFGLFAGLLAPVLLLIELFHAFDQIRSQRPRSGFKKFAMQQTPVLKYSEEPDRTPENPALRSTSEPASGVGQIGGIISALLAIAAAWALFAWNYRFDPAVPGFRFPYERPIEYLYFIGTMMGHFFGLPRATPLEVAVGLLLFTALACICIRQFVGLIKVGVVGNGRAATLFSLSAFSLIFSLHAAVGRTMLGWQTATASRYVTLMIPMAVALLIQLATTPVLARRGLLWVYCGLAAFGTLTFRQAETDGARNLHNNLLNWRAAYLQTHDQTASDRIVNFSIHPGDLSDQLRYLQARRLNLFDADEFQGNTGILEP